MQNMSREPAIVTITMAGDLPSVAFTAKEKKALEEAIQDSIIEILGEYEIWGERFGNDENVYALFLRDVELTRKQPESEKKKRTKSATKKSSSSRASQAKLKKLRNLKPGDEFAYKNVGFGYITYEKGGDVVEKKKGKLFTETFSKMGMEWNGKTWKFDGGVGLVSYIVLMEDVPQDAEFPE